MTTFTNYSRCWRGIRTCRTGLIKNAFHFAFLTDNVKWSVPCSRLNLLIRWSCNIHYVCTFKVCVFIPLDLSCETGENLIGGYRSHNWSDYRFSLHSISRWPLSYLFTFLNWLNLGHSILFSEHMRQIIVTRSLVAIVFLRCLFLVLKVYECFQLI